MQEKGSRLLEHAVAFDETDSHVDEVGRRPLGMGPSGGLDDLGDGGAVAFDVANPGLVDVFFPGPDVPEFGGRFPRRPNDPGLLCGCRPVDTPVGECGALFAYLILGEGDLQSADERLVLREGRTPVAVSGSWFCGFTFGEPLAGGGCWVEWSGAGRFV